MEEKRPSRLLSAPAARRAASVPLPRLAAPGGSGRPYHGRSFAAATDADSSSPPARLPGVYPILLPLLTAGH